MSERTDKMVELFKGNIMHGYDCVADYYDNYLAGRSPADVRRKREDEARERREDQREIDRQMREHYERYGD